MIQLPEKLTVGERILIADSFTGIASGTLYLRGLSSLDVMGTVSGDSIEFEVNTEGLEPGLYSVAIWVLVDGQDRQVFRSRMKLLADIADQSAGTDQRTQAERIVEALEDFIERGASSPHRRYKINNRELERHSLREVLELLNYYRRRVAAETRKRTGRKRPGVKFSL